MPNTRDDAIDISVDDQHIAGTLVTPGALIPGVLFVHGWGGSQQQYVARAREIAALGCICLTFDMRGHARTQEQLKTVTREDNLSDLLAAYDVLIKQRGVDASSVAVVGSSYGGYLATILTTLRPVKWLALRAPALYKDSDWDAPKLGLRQLQNLETYRRARVAPDKNRALRAAAGYRGDVLIVESERDVIIPHPVIQSYREAFAHTRSLTYRMIDGADHGLTDPECRRAYTTILVNWITEMIAGKRSDEVTSRTRLQHAMKEASR